MDTTPKSLALPDAALAEYLEAKVAGFRGPLRSSKFKGGQSNPTYKIEAESGNYVLRRKPFGPLLPSAHAVDREYKVQAGMYKTGFPVARHPARRDDQPHPRDRRGA